MCQAAAALAAPGRDELRWVPEEQQLLILQESSCKRRSRGVRAGSQGKSHPFHTSNSHPEERSGALCTPGCPRLALAGGSPERIRASGSWFCLSAALE